MKEEVCIILREINDSVNGSRGSIGYVVDGPSFESR